MYFDILDKVSDSNCSQEELKALRDELEKKVLCENKDNK